MDYWEAPQCYGEERLGIFRGSPDAFYWQLDIKFRVRQ